MNPADRPAAPDRLLEAAQRAADGQADAGATARTLPGNDGDQQRVLANLARLSALKSAFARLATDQAEQPEGWAHDTPAQWGHLCITGEIGRGAFGVVYRAFDSVLQREVALKLRREDSGSSAANYIEEARRLARIRHPNVLAVHGADVNAGRVGLWADLLDGVPLDVLLGSGPMARPRVLALARQLASALQAIHAAGLVHGDIKAANVMLEGERAVLMDFGAGTEPGVAPRFGSPLTMAPELLRGQAASEGGDIYSLGALLYRAALGRHHRAAAVADPTDAGSSIDAPALRRALGRPAARLVLRMLAERPAERPGAGAVLQELERIAALPRRRARTLAVAVVVGALVVALLASLLALQRVRSERDRSERIKDYVINSLQQTSPMRSSGPPSVHDILDEMVARLDTDLAGLPDARALMRVVIGETQHFLGEDQRGIAMLRQGIAELRTLERPHPRSLVNALVTEAGLLRRNNDMDGALAAAREADAMLARLPNDDATRLARIKLGTVLGNLHNSTGRPLLAMQAHQQGLEQRRLLLSREDPGLAVDYNNIAAAALRAGLLREAEAAYREAARLLESDGKSSSVPMAYVQLGLAKALVAQPGRQQDSRTHAERAAALYATHFPEGHPHLASAEEVLVRGTLYRGDAAGAASGYARLRQHAPAAADWPELGWFAGIALLELNRPEAAVEQFEHAVAAAGTRAAAPMDIVAPAALAYARHLAGEQQDPAPQLRYAVARLAASDYAARPERRRLQQWLDALAAGRAHPATD